MSTYLSFFATGFAVLAGIYGIKALEEINDTLRAIRGELANIRQSTASRPDVEGQHPIERILRG